MSNGTERALNDTERELSENGKRVLRKYTRLVADLFPDRHEAGVHEEFDPINQRTFSRVAHTPEWETQEKEIKDTEGAKRVHEILNRLRNNLTPEMCEPARDEVRITSWPATDLDEETLVYFPAGEKLSSSRFIPLPRTPEDFFVVLEDYATGRMEKKKYAKSDILKTAGIEGGTMDWMKKMRAFIQLVRTVDSLDTLKSMVEKGPRKLAVHISTFGKRELYAGVTLDGRHVFIPVEVDNCALKFVAQNAEHISSENELGAFLDETANYKFFNISSRIESNQIVRKVISRFLSHTKRKDDVDRLAQIVDNSEAMKRLTPQVRGLIRHSFEKRRSEIPA